MFFDRGGEGGKKNAYTFADSYEGKGKRRKERGVKGIFPEKRKRGGKFSSKKKRGGDTIEGEVILLNLQNEERKGILLPLEGGRKG